MADLRQRVYVLHFAQSHTDFRLAELAASAEYMGVPYELLPTPSREDPAGRVGDVSRPFLLCRLPSDEAARQLLRRCSALRGVWELWACADTYEELHARNKAARRFEPWLAPTYSWKALMQGFNVALSETRRLALINSFSYMAFQGPIRMRQSDVTWGVLEEYRRATDLSQVEARGHAEMGDRDPRLVQLFLGRKIKDRSGAPPARDLIDALSLKKRSYIGNTSMESEMSVVMANMALAGPGKWIYDPFAGTGSMLYACSMLGAYTFGSDIDGRMLRGKDTSGVPGVRRAAAQYGLEGRLIDTAVFDMTQSPWRAPFRQGAGLFDAIVTDPPYGVRAGAKRLGRRNVVDQRDEPYIMADGTPAHTRPDYLPPTKPYHLSELIDDLLAYANALLRPGGRLVFWLPTMNEDDAETALPSHEHMDLIAHSLQDFGRWGRRLITLQKRPSAPSAPMPSAPARPAAPGRILASDKPDEFRNRLFAPTHAAPHST
ncbi:Similar to S.cerevisiae protein TRM11 (Catalytic subunit of adoMet-dependent tRNA methyltransferase complex) [Malassezia sympodialis ATCC 42132]|uniref:tRNA (guanine(10)-N(2))-methyltransferase n=1 Tax=Malassezia sympodialis (strain ATCC 42132) TaxID=1230383 RepID=A0A1M8A004_MALS4|nr:Similar to S.cerevisiae protein TRM11 (Catalytic subunit of adoMet-dependent tRNA methyltransferase complex) [Malassezia sympodialis ATCC 42132]